MPVRIINNLHLESDRKRETIKLTDWSQALGPPAKFLDKDLLAFCLQKIRAHWQGRKDLGGVS